MHELAVYQALKHSSLVAAFASARYALPQVAINQFCILAVTNGQKKTRS